MAGRNEIVLSRVFDAPRELVWKALTEPDHVKHWWGPNGFSTDIEVMDVRAGGAWKHTMIGPDGTKFPNKSVFVEVVKPERLVYTHGGGREDGKGAHFRATITLDDVGGKTRVTLHSIFGSPEEREHVIREYGAIEGGTQTLGRLGGYLTVMPGAGRFCITRLFDAPRELVWKAFTEPERLAQWWGPKGFTVETAKVDLRPGGLFHYHLKGPNNAEVWGKFVYREIAAPERFTCVMSFSDPKGGTTRHPWNPGWPLDLLMTVTFIERDGRTTVTLTNEPVNATAAERAAFEEGRDSMRKGFGGTFDQLAGFVSKDEEYPEVVITRTFKANRDLVWRAWTESKRLARWWGPDGFTCPVCEVDARPGGAMRIHMKGPDGTVYPMTAEFREVVEPARLAFVSAIPGPDGKTMAEMLTTVTFAETDGSTTQTMRTRVIYRTPAASPAIAGMNEGWRQTIDRLQKEMEAS